MTSPLDEKALKAAAEAVAGSLSSYVIADCETIIRAYLSNAPAPDELEVMVKLHEAIDAFDADVADGWADAEQTGERPDLWPQETAVPIDLLRQAHSTIAALRVKVDAIDAKRRELLDRCWRINTRAETAEARLETAEAQLKRLTEDNEGLRKAQYQPSDTVGAILARAEAAEARIKALEEALNIASHALMVVQVAIDEDTTALNDTLWVPERFSPNESLLDFVGNARARATLNSREKGE